MKRVIVGLVAALMMASSVAFAQQAQAPIPGQQEWKELITKQGEARKAFNAQMIEEQNVFLKGYPELAASIEAKKAAAKARAEKDKAAKAAKAKKNKSKK